MPDLSEPSFEHDVPRRNGVWARSEDWEPLRARIEELYIQENKKLHELQDIMAIDYGHRATAMMYKRRLMLWGLHKNKRKNAAINGGPRRRGIKKTPPPNRAREKQTCTGTTSVREGVMATQASCSLGPFTPLMSSCTMLKGSELLLHCPRTFDDLDHLIARSGTVPDLPWPAAETDVLMGYSSIDGWCETPANVNRVLYQYLPRSPSTRDSDLSFDRLLYDTKRYYSSLDKLDNSSASDSKFLINIKSIRGDGILGRFSNLWTTGSELMLAQCFVKGRQVFSQVCELLRPILQSLDPSAIIYLLEMHIDISRKLPELGRILRTHIKQLATAVLTDSHPWRALIIDLAAIDGSHLYEALVASWKITNDVLEKYLGRAHPLYISSYTQLISTTNDPNNMEIKFRALTQEAEVLFPQHDERILRLRSEHAWSLFHMGMYQEALSASNELVHLAWRFGATGFEIDCLRLSAACCFWLDRRCEAERQLREALSKLQSCYGVTHPRALRFWSMLRGWMYAWGRNDEATAIVKEMDTLIEGSSERQVEMMFESDAPA